MMWNINSNFSVIFLSIKYRLKGQYTSWVQSNYRLYGFCFCVVLTLHKVTLYAGNFQFVTQACNSLCIYFYNTIFSISTIDDISFVAVVEVLETAFFVPAWAYCQRKICCHEIITLPGPACSAISPLHLNNFNLNALILALKYFLLYCLTDIY